MEKLKLILLDNSIDPDFLKKSNPIESLKNY